ncbi:zinc finger CCCH domain-containing protein 27-like [Papaver somniferum]|nr:zinc finger CCCH domain-containing protein 27-like [Papaver somniferum]
MQSRVSPPPPYADPGACSDFSMGLGCNPLDRGLEKTPGYWSQHHSVFTEYVFQERELQTRGMIPWMPIERRHPFHPSSWQRTHGPPINQGRPTDAFHPFSWQRTLGPPVSHTPRIGNGMPHQRCRDFEELGFCLKGDVCPIDHGVDRIIVEDIQSLSQLNLPVSLSRANFTGTRARTAHLNSECPPSGLSAHSNLIHSNTSRPLMTANRSGLPKLPSTSTGASAVDLYDPDQPPWNIACGESSNALIVKHTSHQKTLRTLYVSHIPPKENKIEPLLSHFQKFGVVDDIFITTDRKKAYIQFSKRESAEAAISSPDAVLGNRFIRLSWAYKDRLLELDESSSSTPHLSPQTSLASRREEDLSFELQEVNAAPVADNHNLASSSQKKIGSSEIFIEEPRLKQELIDENQSDLKPEEQVLSVKTQENTEKAVEKHEVGRVTKGATKIPTNLVDSGYPQGNMKTLDNPKLTDLSDAAFLAEAVVPPGLSSPPSSIIRLACNVASQATISTDTEKLVAQRNINENCQNLNIV